MFCNTSKMMAKTKLVVLTMVVASVTFGIAAAMTANTILPQTAYAQGTQPPGGIPTYSPPGGNATSGNSTSGNSTSGNATK
jgi:hypothetical protein